MASSNHTNMARSKIKPLEQLAATLTPLRAKNRKIVHCHGVFDLLHIGHIRHFQQAREMGDMLVVTLTPDRYVNKGPHRPAFSEVLRAESIAALDCVDYVAINKWPTAVETIRLLQPSFYVKGSDYKEADKDRTGGIVHEEAATKAVGGQIIFTDDITFSASSLINQHIPILPSNVRDYITGFSERYSAENVIRYIEGAQALKVLVVGEAIIDDYQYCSAIGKSSKEPALAVRVLSHEEFAGGTLAVSNHVTNFSGHSALVTYLGAENSREEFINRAINAKTEKVFLYRKDAPTIVKRRFIESYFFTKLLEVYEINDSALQRSDNDELCATLHEIVPKYDVVIVVDYGHGMLSEEATDILGSKARFLAVNAQANAGNLGYHTVGKYSRADYICMAENEIRLETRDKSGDLQEMVLDVSRKLGCPQVVVTRGKAGCLAYREDEGFYDLPAFAGEVVDRVGAGDAFLSVTALCVAQKAPIEVVAFIGNAAGAQAVATVGNRKAIERVPLVRHIETLLK